MNALCYKVIFSKRLGALVAVGENATSQGKSASGAGNRSVEVPLSQGGAAGGYFVGTLKVLFTSSVLACMATTHSFAAPAANTLPTGYSVNSGNVAVSTAGANMTIKQNTDKASINWQSFSIGSAASVNIQQNSASSVLLNRVVGNDPSQIFGKLTANGQVILINPNGIVFGKGGSVVASAFTASTFGMTDTDFQNGKYKFNRNGSTAGVTVENGASIQTTTPGGYVALLGASVNNQGEIHTQQAAVVMASGESVALPSTLTDSVGVPLSGKVRLELTPSTINASVENGGTITTDGGQVLMQAAAVADAVASVTHTGVVDTSGVQGGSVTLRADHGTIKANGSITANSADASNKGGDIIIGRDEVTGELAATTDVSGAHLESKGGFVETSGEHLQTGDVFVKAANWLLDPTDIEINDGVTATNATYSQVSNTVIQTALNNGTTVTIATTGAGSTTTAGGLTPRVPASSEEGNILVSGAIVKSGANSATLNLTADKNITVNQRIGLADGDAVSAGNLNVNLTAGGNIELNAVVDARQGNVTLNATGANSTVTQEQAIRANGLELLGNTADYNLTNAANAVNTLAGNVKSVNYVNSKALRIGNVGGSTGLTSSGDMTVSGTTGVDDNFGLTVSNAVKSTGGKITLTGRHTGINNRTNVGLWVAADIGDARSGEINLTGTSSTSTGIFLNGGLISSTKKIALTGTAGGGGLGVNFNGGNGITSLAGGGDFAGADAISITGTAINNVGVWVRNAAVTNNSTNGRTYISGTATNVTGTSLSNAVTATSGDIVIEGKTVAGGNAGLQFNATGPVSTAGNIRVTGVTQGSGLGFYGAGSITSTKGDVTISGTSVTGGGVTLQGTVTAQNNVTINGTSSSTASGNQGVVIQNAVEAKTGDITVTGNTNSNVQRAVAITNNGAVNGALQTVANGSKININADTLFINGSVDSGTSGTVTVKTTSGNAIGLGVGDTTNSTVANRVLGIEQSELNFVKAGKLIIGDTTTVGNIRVASAVTTKDETGNLLLKTAGNVNFDRSLTVGTNGGKNLSIEAASINSDKLNGNGSGVVTANELKIKGSTATVAMADVAHQVNTISADVNSLAFKNGKALSVGKVFASTNDEQSGIKTTGVTSLTGTGTVTQTSAISADGLELLGSTADFTLNNASNAVNTIAANTKSVSFTNSKDLAVDQVNNTSGITTTGNTSLTTKVGDLTLKKAINASAATVTLNAAAAVVRDASLTTDNIIANTLNIKAGSNIGSSANRVKTKVATLSMDSGGSQYVTEADAVTISAHATTGNIEIETTNGTLTVGSSTLINGVKADTGNIVLKGVTGSGHGLFINQNIETTGGDVTLLGTTGDSTDNAYAGVFGGTNTSIKGNNITMDAKATSTQGKTLGYRGAGAQFIATGALDFKGTSQNKGNGWYTFGGVIQAEKGIKITGTSVLGQGVGFDKQGNNGNLVAITNGKLPSSSGGITITGTATETNQQAIGLNGSSVVNNGDGNILLEAITGKLEATNTFSGAIANTIASESSAGQVKLKAGNSATDAGLIDGTNLTITQKSGAGVIMETTGTGNLTVAKIVNSGIGNVVVAAGSMMPDGLGGQVKTTAGQTVTNNAGKTYIYTGNASETGKLENLMGSLATLYLSKVGDNAQNAQLNTAYPNSVVASSNTIPNGAAAQVMFRENTKFDEIQINPATLTMNAGQVDPSTASFAAAVAAANTNGAALTKASITENKFKISTDSAGIAGTLPTPSNQARTTGTYDYATTSSIANKVSSTSAAPAVKLVVQASSVIPVPAPVVPTSNPTRVKVPVGSANPFALASAESLDDDVCSANSLENCHCEESSVNEGVNICYEPHAGSK